MFMSDDAEEGRDKILKGHNDEIIRDWLDSQARLNGFNNWVEAYHWKESDGR